MCSLSFVLALGEFTCAEPHSELLSVLEYIVIGSRGTHTQRPSMPRKEKERSRKRVRKGKGSRGRKKETQFKPGHTRYDSNIQPVESPQNKQYKAFNTTEYDRRVIERPVQSQARIIKHLGPELVTEDCLHTVVSNTILRPRPDKKNFYASYNEDESLPAGDNECNIIVHRTKMVEGITTAAKDHLMRHPDCDGMLQWHDKGSERRGVSWAVTFHCDQCSYTSDKFKLYREIPSTSSGRKASETNYSIIAGSFQQGIGHETLSSILHSVNCASMDKRHYQRTANKMAPELVRLNKEDMAARRKELKNVNQALGEGHNTGTGVGIDCCYNNQMFRPGYTPGQGGTMSTSIMCETSTKQRQIVAGDLFQRICTCPGRHEGKHEDYCVLSLPEDAVIGNEAEYFRRLLAEILEDDDPLDIVYVVQDDDSVVAKAARDMKISVMKCTEHLKRTLGRQIRGQSYSEEMFEGDTQEARRMWKNRFAWDLTYRLQAEFSTVCERYRGDQAMIRKKTKELPDAIIACYEGKHELCIEYSFVCTKDSPWQRLFGLYVEGQKNLDDSWIIPTDSDRTTLREMINKRFGCKAMRETYLNENTNKVEAVNRIMRKVLPRRNDFRRTGRARVAMGILGANNGHGKAGMMARRVLNCPVPRDCEVQHQIEKKDDERVYHQKRQATAKFKTRDGILRQARYRLNDGRKEQKAYNSGGVKRKRKAKPTTRKRRGNFTGPETLDSPAKKRRKSEQDHTYC